MTRILATGVLEALLTLAVLGSIAFALTAISPIDPARSALTHGIAGVSVDDATVEAKRQELGLDRPVWERYATWWRSAVTLDLGTSYMTTRPVTEMLRERLIGSMALAGVAFAFTVAVSLPLGLVLAFHAGGRLDAMCRTLLMGGAALPNFWVGLLVLWLFAATLHWFPAIGRMTPHGIVLPAAVLAFAPLARMTRMVRATAIESLHQDYIVAARARGASEFRLAVRHVLPNALAPLASLLGLDAALFVGDAVVIESVFSWPGIGALGASAGYAGDVPVLIGVVLAIGLVITVANFCADVLAAILDPRIRVEGHG